MVDPETGMPTPVYYNVMQRFLTRTGGTVGTNAAIIAYNANAAQATATAAQTSANAAATAVTTETTRAEAAEALLLPKLGVTDGSDAVAGNIGEFISATVVAASAVSLVTATAKNVTSISLTAGDWDVWGSVGFKPAATTSITVSEGGINTTSATMPSTTTGAHWLSVTPAVVPVSVYGAPVGMTRINLTTTTTVYLVASSTFTVSTQAAYGFIGARRVR